MATHERDYIEHSMSAGRLANRDDILVILSDMMRGNTSTAAEVKPLDIREAAKQLCVMEGWNSPIATYNPPKSIGNTYDHYSEDEIDQRINNLQQQIETQRRIN